MDLLAYDPATGFAQVYKEQFTAAADDFFEKAVQEGKIDVSLNEQLSGELKKLQVRKEKMDGTPCSGIDSIGKCLYLDR